MGEGSIGSWLGVGITTCSNRHTLLDYRAEWSAKEWNGSRPEVVADIKQMRTGKGRGRKTRLAGVDAEAWFW